LDFIVQRFFESVNNRESRLQRSTADGFDRPRAIHEVLFQGVVDVFEANCVSSQHYIHTMPNNKHQHSRALHIHVRNMTRS